ncbi:MAG: hypothetical protein ACHP7M_09025 [Burkholderiales bacterium]|jgi:hypothetical protein
MNLDSYMQRWCYALGAALVLATATASANSSTAATSVPPAPVKVAVADSAETMAAAPDSTTPRSFPSSEAGVRRAAAQGSGALRRYIWRTRMIYNYYFWDFATRE